MNLACYKLNLWIIESIVAKNSNHNGILPSNDKKLVINFKYEIQILGYIYIKVSLNEKIYVVFKILTKYCQGYNFSKYNNCFLFISWISENCFN